MTTQLIPDPCDAPETGQIVRLDTLDEERLAADVAHLRAQNGVLHQRCDTLQGALSYFSNRVVDTERALADLRALLALGPCSLCRGDGCEAPTCRRAPPAPAS